MKTWVLLALVGTVLASGFSLPMLSFGDFVFSNSHEQVKYLLSLDQVGNDCALYRAYYQGWRRQSDYFRCGTSKVIRLPSPSLIVGSVKGTIVSNLVQTQKVFYLLMRVAEYKVSKRQHRE